MREATRRELTPRVPKIKDARYEVGYGLNVWVEERLVQVGSARFMHMSGIVIPQAMQQAQDAAHEEGHSLVYVAMTLNLQARLNYAPPFAPKRGSWCANYRR